jgi:hypothetical protein
MRQTIALDANLLVLLVVGLTNPGYIEKHRRLKAYRVEDFEILAHTIAESAGVVVTPNALSEASNLLRQIEDPARTAIGAAFQRLISNTKELYIESAAASARNEFLRFGLADNVLLEVAKNNIVVVSVDGIAPCVVELDGTSVAG